LYCRKIIYKIQGGRHGGHLEFSLMCYNSGTICHNLMEIAALHANCEHTTCVKIYIFKTIKIMHVGVN